MIEPFSSDFRAKLSELRNARRLFDSVFSRAYSPERFALSGSWSWLGTLTTLAGGAGLGLIYLLRRPLPKVEGAVSVPGLEGEVEIIRDRYGIPHITAQTERNLFFAQGFVQAQDRLWQCDLMRRVATGRLAEVVGEQGLAIDRFYRRLGLARAAQKEMDALDPKTRELLEAFADGINALIDSRRGLRTRLPIEFTLLAYDPEPWDVFSSLAVAKFLGWALSVNWETELLRARLIERLGPEVASSLEPLYPRGHPITTLPGEEYEGRDTFDISGFVEIGDILASLLPRGASNGWVVGPERSATGQPILANDPHLGPQIPNFWHETHLSGAGYDVIGVSVPGAPGIIIGHNADLAWGITMSFADTQDLFLEKFHPDNPRLYEHRGQWKEAEVYREEIKVRGRWGPVVEEVMVTVHGPLLDESLSGPKKRALALSSSNFESSNLTAIIELGRAKSWSEFRGAVQSWGLASLNFIYADRQGNIGYAMSGKIPIRKQGEGLGPAPGWTGDYDWQGFVPNDEMPSAFNPKPGYLLNANNKPVGDDYPYHISHEWADGFRARRIEELIRAEPTHCIESMSRIQLDTVSIAARELTPILLTVPDRYVEIFGGAGRRAVKSLRGWDCNVSSESAPAALYEVWRYELLRVVFSDLLSDDFAYYLGRGHEQIVRGNINRGRIMSHLLQILRERPGRWLKEGDAWEDLIGRAFGNAMRRLLAEQGNDPALWRWGQMHKVTFHHPLGIGPLAALFDRGPYPISGDNETVASSSVDYSDPFDAHGSTVSLRLIIDLADFDRSVATLPCGQSGHPGSAHYADQYLLWAEGKYHPLPFTRAAVLGAAAQRLVLRGASGKKVGPEIKVGREIGVEGEVI